MSMILYECDGKIEKCMNHENCKNQGGECHSTFDKDHGINEGIEVRDGVKRSEK